MARLRRRVEWLEFIIRDRLPDVDLAGETPPQETAGSRADQQEARDDLAEIAPAPLNPLIPSDQRAHEIGLISIGANSDQKYIGPSSGYFLARLLLAKSPQRNRNDISEPRLDTTGGQFLINELVDATKGSLPLPKRALVNRLSLQRNVTARTSISLLEQEMRTRLFWVVYTFDRTISNIMGRPIGLRDEACELRLPQDIDDETFTAANATPNPPRSISISIHLFKLAKITSEFKYVANSIVHSAPAYAYPPISDMAAWQLDMLDRLDHWNADLPQHVCDDSYMKTLCEVRYHTMKMLLLRPSPAIPMPSQASLTACHASARQILRLFSRLNRQQLLVYDWLTLHGIVSSTITMLYCTRSVPDIARNTDTEDLMSDMNINLSILSSMGEHWTGARRARDVLEDLGTATLRWVRSLETREERVVDSFSDGHATTNHTAVDGAALGGNGAVDSNPPNNLHIDASIWSDAFDQTNLFGDNMDVDAFMRTLFDGFIPQVDIFDASSQEF
ncbi:c6 transcription factor [Stemphylium lycopersici]|uniref:Fungal specific transcription factor domain-containing protein n=1 Tax=Stemphylium lycopersici TaxID=183478 RepID=A0A364N4H5_STELY|nr:c6 transcription factor [Stemphylium lycopersici]RAR11774.1 Fungal specific transcription factor domain-containing protein [Stemphylium lycopersici]